MSTIYPNFFSPPCALCTPRKALKRNWLETSMYWQLKGVFCLNSSSQYGRDKCFETKLKRTRGERVLPICTLRTYNRKKNSIFLLCWKKSIQQSPSAICTGLFPTKICGLPLWRHSPYFKLPWKYVLMFFNTALIQHWLRSIAFHSFTHQVRTKHSTTGRVPRELQRFIWLCLSSPIAPNQAKRTVNLWLARHKYGRLRRLGFLPSFASWEESWLSSTENKLIPTARLQRLSLSDKATPWPGSFHCWTIT